MNQFFDEQWQTWMFDFPRNSSTPGQDGEFSTLWEYLDTTMHWIVRVHGSQGFTARTVAVLMNIGASVTTTTMKSC